MRNIPFILLFLMFLSPVAMAAEEDTEGDTTTTLCSLLAASTDDVAFKPGVDVHGKAVVPADVDSATTYALPDVIRIPLTVDLAEAIQPQLPEALKMDSQVSMIEIFNTGHVIYNGQDITMGATHVCNIDVDKEKHQTWVSQAEAKAARDEIEAETQKRIEAEPPKDEVIWGSGY